MFLIKSYRHRSQAFSATLINSPFLGVKSPLGMSNAMYHTRDTELHGNDIVKGFYYLCSYVWPNISTFSVSRFNPVMNLFTRHVIILGFAVRIIAVRDSIQLEKLSSRC